MKVLACLELWQWRKSRSVEQEGGSCNTEVERGLIYKWVTRLSSHSKQEVPAFFVPFPLCAMAKMPNASAPFFPFAHAKGTPGVLSGLWSIFHPQWRLKEIQKHLSSTALVFLIWSCDERGKFSGEEKNIARKNPVFLYNLKGQRLPNGPSYSSANCCMEKKENWQVLKYKENFLGTGMVSWLCASVHASCYNKRTRNWGTFKQQCVAHTSEAVQPLQVYCLARPLCSHTYLFPTSSPHRRGRGALCRLFHKDVNPFWGPTF